MKLVTIGDNVVDRYLDLGRIYPGGNAVNVAVAAKRNGAENCAYIGITGDDAAALHVIHSLKMEGIDLAQIRQTYGPNGEASVTLNEKGDRIFIGTNRGIRMSSLLQLKLTEPDLAYISTFDMIHTSVNSDIEHELPRLNQRPVSFDFSTKNRWNEKYLRLVCPYLAYAFFSGSDMELDEINALIAYVHELGVKVVGVTRGSEAAQFSCEGIRYEQTPLEVDVLDTMGAGDSFIGGFLASYHGTRNMEKALQQAAGSAAATCQHYGAYGYGINME